MTFNEISCVHLYFKRLMFRSEIHKNVITDSCFLQHSFAIDFQFSCIISKFLHTYKFFHWYSSRAKYGTELLSYWVISSMISTNESKSVVFCLFVCLLLFVCLFNLDDLSSLISSNQYQFPGNRKNVTVLQLW